jgi:hypothetical protein
VTGKRGVRAAAAGRVACGVHPRPRVVVVGPGVTRRFRVCYIAGGGATAELEPCAGEHLRWLVSAEDGGGAASLRLRSIPEQNSSSTATRMLIKA